jgi:hypothetical protein
MTALVFSPIIPGEKRLLQIICSRKFFKPDLMYLSARRKCEEEFAEVVLD